MKSEHRHELKTNELAQWLSNLPQWSKENLSTIIGVVAVIVILAGIFGWRFHTKKVKADEQLEFTNKVGNITNAKVEIVSQQRQGQGGDFSYILLNQAKDMKKFSASIESRNMAALALIEQADTIRAEMHYRPETISKRYLTEKINEAKTGYTEAIEKSPSNTTIMALAAFGLGLCAEELGNFDQAREIYNNIIEEDDFEGTVVVSKARRRLNTMDDYKQEIVFQPAPIIEPNIAMEPEVTIMSVDANQPVKVNFPPKYDISDVNLSIDTNLPIESNLPEEFNMPSEINLPMEVNLPADINENIE